MDSLMITLARAADMEKTRFDKVVRQLKRDLGIKELLDEHEKIHAQIIKLIKREIEIEGMINAKIRTKP